MTETSDFRICRSCLQAKPVEKYRRRQSGSEERMKECNDCHYERERLRRAKRRSREDRRRVGAFLTQMNRTQSRQRIELLVAMICDSFGGVERFAAYWVDCIRSGAERGSPVALRSFVAIASLMEYLKQPAGDGLESLSDEELEAEVNDATRRILEREPELALAAAQRLGAEL